MGDFNLAGFMYKSQIASDILLFDILSCMLQSQLGTCYNYYVHAVFSPG